MINMYNSLLSTASFRTRMALAYKGLDYNKINVDLRAGDQRTDDYKKLNPASLVPTIVTDDQHIIHQSIAIIEYLEECYKEPPLLPSLSHERAYVRAIALDMACEIQPLNNLRVWNYLKDELKISEAQKHEWYLHWLHLGLGSLEQFIVQSAYHGSYCLGNQFTLADICLVGQFFHASRFSVDVSRYPTLVAINANCCKLAAVQQAWPKQ